MFHKFGDVSLIIENKAKAISAKLLELNLKNKLEGTRKQDETGRNRKKQEETEKLEGKNTANRKKLDDTE